MAKVMDATLMISELLRWTRPQIHQWIETIMNQAIKQGFPEKIGS